MVNIVCFLKHCDLFHTKGLNLAQVPLQEGKMNAVFPSIFHKKTLFSSGISQGLGSLPRVLWNAGPKSSKFPSTFRFYSGGGKGTRAPFCLLPEQSPPCDPDRRPPRLLFPKAGAGREKCEHREEGSKRGPWLWWDPSNGLLQIQDWDKQGLMPQVLRYHVIACYQLLLENLKVTPNATSLQGEPIVISVSQVRGATSGRCSFSLGLLSSLP